MSDEGIILDVEVLDYTALSNTPFKCYAAIDYLNLASSSPPIPL